MTREDREVSIGRRNPRGYGEGQPDAEAPTERLTLPEQGAGTQDPNIQAAASKSSGIRVNKPLITRRPDERWTRTQQVNEPPTLAEGGREPSGPDDATQVVDSALAAQLTERITPGPLADAPTAAFATPDAPTVVTPGLDSTRVGSPDPEDPVQRGVRAFRRSAGRGLDAADAVYGRIQRVTHAEGAGESGLAH